ncbi:MAG: LamG domain-containing protein [Candidatus Brocadiae bacterium]|nr:LamG domain-containing protein [Candidatus Brocadiia bacterium]
MGKIFLCLLLFVLSIRLPAALVAHYAFNGNTNDAIYGNNAVVYGDACLTQDRFGNLNSAYRFDGNGDYLRITNASQINFSRTQDFSVAFWVKPDVVQPYTVNSDNDMVEKWSGTSGYPFVVRYINQKSSSNGRVSAARYNGTTSAGTSSNDTIHDGQFHHILFTKTGSTLSLYIDGIFQNSTTDLTSGDTTNTSDLYIASRGGNINFFAGTIDDLRIYNHSISTLEMQELVPEVSCLWMALVSMGMLYIHRKRLLQRRK